MKRRGRDKASEVRGARAASPEIGSERCVVQGGRQSGAVLKIHVCTDFDAGRGNGIDIVGAIDLVNR